MDICCAAGCRIKKYSLDRYFLENLLSCDRHEKPSKQSFTQRFHPFLSGDLISFVTSRYFSDMSRARSRLKVATSSHVES